MSSIRDNLLVTAGARAAYMECNHCISIPSGAIGEDTLADFISKVVDRYIEKEFEICFDEYIESCLEDEYGIS